MPEHIGIIAGGGQFPRLVAQGAREAGLSVVACGFHGHTDPALAGHVDVFRLLHLGQLNKLLAYFHDQGVRRLCLAGTINKPRALDFRPDWRAARVVFSLRTKGDDSLLRPCSANWKKKGLKCCRAADLVPSLRCPPGTLTRREPDPRGLGPTFAMPGPWRPAWGALISGQCLVVRQGMVIAVECLEGTDATLKRGAELGGKGCVALKIAKPGQDERVDLPSVGLTTIRNLVEGGYAALAVQAGKTLFFDREASLSPCRQA